MNIEKILKQLDENTGLFFEKFGSLPEDKLNFKPNPKTWSIAQNIDHLIVVNETYFPIIRRLQNDNYETPFLAKYKFIVNFFSNFILKSVQPDRKRKMKTMSIWEPAQSKSSKEILKKFGLHQEKLKKMMSESQDLVSRGAIISSPANKMIVYKLETAFEIITFHELRHFEQAKLNLEYFQNRVETV